MSKAGAIISELKSNQRESEASEFKNSEMGPATETPKSVKRGRGEEKRATEKERGRL